MEASVVPEDIGFAAWFGHADVVQAWLDRGGDPNALYRYSNGPAVEQARPLLLAAARWGRISIMELLLSRGADIDATDADGRTAVYELVDNWWSIDKELRLPALRVLLSRGIDVNLASIRHVNEHGTYPGRSPLMLATGILLRRKRSPNIPFVVLHLLRAGADVEQRVPGPNNEYHETAQGYAREYHPTSADLLRDVSFAGGWARYFLSKSAHYDLLVFRALCHRGRATFDSWTPEVLVRLFGAPEARRRNNAVRGRVDLPDPLFWRVLEFSLAPVYDYPWVRERLRARAAAVAAAE